MKNQVSLPIHDVSAGDFRLKGFKVYEIANTVSGAPTYSRRDFFKITLSTGHMLIHYADKSIEMNGAFFFFANPHIPYSVELLTGRQTGYSCLFTEEFLKAGDRSESLQESPLFKIGGTPVLVVNSQQKEFIESLFRKMLSEQDTEYIFKNELIRNYVGLLIHEALKMQPMGHFFTQKRASSRITALFLELLERQFPIDNLERPLRLRTAQDFAQRLSIHINHLNRSVKETTGKPTTAHISERIISEAKALVQHTDWSTAQIAYALGFEYPTYFNNYFKRMTGTVPLSFRV